MTYLPDVNVWIALAAERHTRHRIARHWFSNLLTDKQVMPGEAMSPDEAWQAYRVLLLDRRIGYMGEPHQLPETWEAFTRGPLSSPNLWTGA